MLDLDFRHPVDEVTNIGLLVRLYKYIPNILANLAGIESLNLISIMSGNFLKKLHSILSSLVGKINIKLEIAQPFLLALLLCNTNPS